MGGNSRQHKINMTSVKVVGGILRSNFISWTRCMRLGTSAIQQSRGSGDGINDIYGTPSHIDLEGVDRKPEPIYHPAEEEDVQIPTPKMRSDEPVDVKRSRLVYQSRKRGMLENGIILSTFASKFLSSMEEPQLTMYDKLINLPSNDWEIYYWAIGQKPVPAEYESEVMDMLIKHAKNEDLEVRNHQPGLYGENQ